LLVVTFCLLTLITQVGGIVLLLTWGLWSLLRDRFKSRWLKVAGPYLLFIVLYLITTFVFVPITARSYGRVSLPVFERDHVAPLTWWTCILNRNYVRGELANAVNDVATKMNDKYPGTTVHYLDASFPWIDGFPLFPHLSHSDGKKLDLSFHYEGTEQAPSFIGYGICEEPREGEENMPAACESQGYWRYSMTKRVYPQDNKSKFKFDRDRTKSLVYYFSRETDISTIFIEPHLKKRLGLTSPKIKFHGCGAVRHDDHVHVQVY